MDMKQQREKLKQITQKPGKPKGNSPKARDRRMQEKGRLPHGSSFHVEYDGHKQLWAGRLTIGAGNPDEMVTFRGEASGVFKLLAKLDDAYRLHLRQQGK